MTTASRGQIYHIDYGPPKGKHYYVVVSNNRRNKNLNSVVGAMITSTDKSHIASAVLLTHQDSFSGSYIVADDLDTLWDEEVAGAPDGAVSPLTMAKLDAALRIALALT